MKPVVIILSLLIGFTSASCTTSADSRLSANQQQPGADDGDENSGEDNDRIPDPNEPMKIQLNVGGAVFTATLESNPAAEAFASMLPLTLEMVDVNSNEKYIQLDGSLPADAANPEIINTGDIMLWGTNGLVIFYKSFRTSYSYTRLGKIDDPSLLEECLGKGSVRVDLSACSI